MVRRYYELLISGFGNCGMIQLINALGERVCIYTVPGPVNSIFRDDIRAGLDHQLPASQFDQQHIAGQFAALCGGGERRAMSVGLLAFTLLIPLALTSTNGWQMAEHDIRDWVLVYAAVVIILFVVRYPAIRRNLARRRQRLPEVVSENLS